MAGLTPEQIESVVGWTRRFHDAVTGFWHPGPWRFPGAPQPTIVGHNDIAPYNVCFDGDVLVGVFDWDLAGPTTPLLELGFLAWNGVSLWRDIGTESSADRLTLIASVYGQVSAREILDAVPHRIQLMLDGIPTAAAAGDAGMINLMTQGEPGRSQTALDALRRRMPAISARCG